MKLFELSQIPFKERFRLVNEIKATNAESSPDIRIVREIFDEVIDWFRAPTSQSDPDLRRKLELADQALPSFFKTIYEIQEKHKIKELPNHERQRIFDESKDAWRKAYPDFDRISKIMSKYKSDQMLVEFQKKSPPSFICEKAIEIYKKCLSYKAQLKQHKIEKLGYSYTPGPLCIDRVKVNSFTTEYADWGRRASVFWNAIYSQRDKYLSLYSYEDWKWCISHGNLLKNEADRYQETQDNALALLDFGIKMLERHDQIITLECKERPKEKSYHDREMEVSLFNAEEFASDDEYCYVYTLECDLFVFYVGIAANPQERLEQHLRGALSNEAHLFKSKFIQKFYSQIRQKIIFEGPRKKCKEFERNYIAQHSPLGNMTQGGEG
jgi:predicted GIY-YIG superfamily endonuclease